MKLLQALEAKVKREYQTIVSLSTPFKFSDGPHPSIKLVPLAMDRIPLLDPPTREVFFYYYTCIYMYTNQYYYKFN